MTFKKTLLAILYKVKKATRHLESYLRNEDHQSTNSVPPPVIGYDAYLNKKRGRALICYLPEPFSLPPNSQQLFEHQNLERSLEIARVFNRLGYLVDVIRCYDISFVPKNDYQILFGMDSSFIRMSRILSESVIKIFFVPEPYPPFRHKAEIQRMNALKGRRGRELNLRSRNYEGPDPNLVDAVVAIGNTWVGSTYSSIYKNVYVTGDGGFDFLKPTLSQKDFLSARKNFLWMASWLCVGKGLDLVLEVFRNLPELKLFICGPIWNEPDFIEVYERELFHTDNIHFKGKQKLMSEEFEELTRKIGFTIFPTSGDAATGSVWAPMRCGVIPIVSRENGMDTGDFGITLASCSLEDIRDTVVQASTMDPEDIRTMANRACLEGSENYSLQAWSQRFEKVLRSIFVQRGML